jgi:hypothetical protein
MAEIKFAVGRTTKEKQQETIKKEFMPNNIVNQ